MRRFFKSKRNERAQQLRVPKSPPNWPENKGDSHPIRHRTATWDDGATRSSVAGSVGDQEAPWTRGRATNSIDVFSLPGLPVWGAPSTLKGNFENRDEDLSVASCVESLWSTKTVRAPSVLDPKDQGFHRAVMSKLGLQETCLASGAPIPRSLPGLKAVFSAYRAVCLYQKSAKTTRYEPATLATSSVLKPRFGDYAFSVDPSECGGAPLPWGRAISSPDYRAGTANVSPKVVDIQYVSDPLDNASQIERELKDVPRVKDDTGNKSPASKHLSELLGENDMIGEFKVEYAETHKEAQHEPQDIHDAALYEYDFSAAGSRKKRTRDLPLGLGDAQAVAAAFTNPEGPTHTSPPLRITCSGDYHELNSNALTSTFANGRHSFRASASCKTLVDSKDRNQEESGPDEPSTADSTVAKSESSSSSHSYQFSVHGDDAVSTFDHLDTSCRAKSAEADRPSGIPTIGEPLNAGFAESLVTEQGTGEPDFFSSVKLDPNFESTPVLIEEKRATPLRATSIWPAFDVFQKQNNDYFQMFDPLQNVAGVEHKSTSMSGDVFESLSTEFPSRRQTAYSVALSPIPSDISLKVASPSFTSIGDNDSQSSARSFVTVTSDNDDEACALDLSNEGVSSANLSGMVSPVLTESPLPAGSYNLYRCSDMITLTGEQQSDDASKTAIQSVTTEQTPVTQSTSASTTTLTSFLAARTTSEETDTPQDGEEGSNLGMFCSSTRSQGLNLHPNEGNFPNHQHDSARSLRGYLSCQSFLHQVHSPKYEISTSRSSSFLPDRSIKTLPLDAASDFFSFSGVSARPGLETLEDLQQYFSSTSITNMPKDAEFSPLRLQNQKATLGSILSQGQTQRMMRTPVEAFTAVTARSPEDSVSMPDLEQLGRTKSLRAVSIIAEQGASQKIADLSPDPPVQTAGKQTSLAQELHYAADETSIVGNELPESVVQTQAEDYSR
ncbi:hypothetical protein ISCGN_025523 [Ixodes scapularis]